MTKKKSKDWVYTRSRKNSTKKAQARHVVYVRLGKRAYEKGER